MHRESEQHAWIEVHGIDSHAMQQVVLDMSLCRIGSSTECELQIAQPGVSRHHATIELRSYGIYWITDEDSSYGTVVDGVALKARESRRLRHQAQIELGSAHVRLSFYAPHSTRPPDQFPNVMPATATPASPLFWNADRQLFVLYGQPLRLHAQALTLLRLLYEARRRVTAEEGIATLWSDDEQQLDADLLYVSFMKAVSRLRKSLEDHQQKQGIPPEQRVTVHNQRHSGYLLLVPSDPSRSLP